MHFRVSLLAVASVAPFLIPGSGTAAAQAAKTVRLKDFTFSPGVVHVNPGGRVTWKWQDEYVKHIVRSRGRQRFKSSGFREQGATYSVRFPTAGTYRYVCTIHAGMTGRVVVG